MIAAHSKIKDVQQKLNVEKKQKEESSLINSTKLSSPYDGYKEKFQSLSSYYLKRRSKPQHDKEDSLFSFDRFCVSLVCILSFVRDYFIILK